MLIRKYVVITLCLNCFIQNFLFAAHHPPDSFFKTLDSSVKKNSLFVKKLSSLTEASRDRLVQDLNSLNLTKYIEEVVSAICGAKLKVCATD